MAVIYLIKLHNGKILSAGSELGGTEFPFVAARKEKPFPGLTLFHLE